LLIISNLIVKAYEKAAREQRMRAEISQAKREAGFYLENVGKGKAITAMNDRREKKKRKAVENLVCINLFRQSFSRSV